MPAPRVRKFYYVNSKHLNGVKYSHSIEIMLPRAKVVELFDSSENLKKWQPGFISYEHLSGEPGRKGATAKLVYQMGKRKTEMIETITLNELPEAFHGTYETNGVRNIQENFFVEKSAEVTEWTSVSEFRFSNLMMKAMGWILPGAFKKQSYLFMEKFKEFAESES